MDRTKFYTKMKASVTSITNMLSQKLNFRIIRTATSTKRLLHNAALLTLLLFSPCGFPQPITTLPITKPENMDMSSDGFKKINTVMQSYIDDKKLPGIITMVARHGKLVNFEKFGMMGVDRPMQLDAIFRIASMTKPITSVAVMMLYEEGRFQLDDPVAKYIPEFENLKVFTCKNKDGIHVEDPKKQMTIRNLLIHTSGLGSGSERSVVDSLYKAADMVHSSLKEKMQKLAKIPLKYQPGTRWSYGHSTDVLGYLVEVLSGKPLDVFFKERIFTPLNMNDIGYSVPADKHDRVPSVYCPSKTGIEAIQDPEINNVSPPSRYIAGNGGLLSTATDYMIFSQMLLNKGTYNGVRILSSKTVELMTSNQLLNEKMPDDDFLGKIMQGMGYGLGFSILEDRTKANTIASQGSFWWSGTANTYFFIDPKEELILILMTQFVPNYYYPVFSEFRELVYESIIK